MPTLAPVLIGTSGWHYGHWRGPFFPDGLAPTGGPPIMPHGGRYDGRTLTAWAASIAAWSQPGREVFCNFNNGKAGYAVPNALHLQDLLRHR
jgi:uncharacterized protein YecE (DUF72 family)